MSIIIIVALVSFFILILLTFFMFGACRKKKKNLIHERREWANLREGLRTAGMLTKEKEEEFEKNEKELDGLINSCLYPF